MVGVVCVILRLAILVQCRLVTDRRTDGRTHNVNIYRASIASRKYITSLLSEKDQVTDTGNMYVKWTCGFVLDG